MTITGRRTPQGVRGLKSKAGVKLSVGDMSHPARGAWIEMESYKNPAILVKVAPRKGCVD